MSLFSDNGANCEQGVGDAARLLEGNAAALSREDELAALQHTRSRAELRPTEVGGVYHFDASCSAYAIRYGDASCVLVNTGSAETASELLDQLLAVGLHPTDILITHHFRATAAGAQRICDLCMERNLPVPTVHVPRGEEQKFQDITRDLLQAAGASDEEIAQHGERGGSYRTDSLHQGILRPLSIQLSTLAPGDALVRGDVCITSHQLPSVSSGSMIFVMAREPAGNSDQAVQKILLAGDLVRPEVAKGPAASQVDAKVPNLAALQWRYPGSGPSFVGLHNIGAAIEGLRQEEFDCLMPGSGDIVYGRGNVEALWESLSSKISGFPDHPPTDANANIPLEWGAWPHPIAGQGDDPALHCLVGLNCATYVIMTEQGRTICLDYGSQKLHGYTTQYRGQGMRSWEMVQMLKTDRGSPHQEKPIDFVVPTHGHDDHIGTVAVLKEELGDRAPVIIASTVLERTLKHPEKISSRCRFSRALLPEDAPLLPPLQPELFSRMDFDLRRPELQPFVKTIDNVRIALVPVAGHSRDTNFVFIEIDEPATGETRRVAHVGDNFCLDGSQFGKEGRSDVWDGVFIANPVLMNGCDYDSFRTAAALVAGFKPDYVWSGHGPGFPGYFAAFPTEVAGSFSKEEFFAAMGRFCEKVDTSIEALARPRKGTPDFGLDARGCEIYPARIDVPRASLAEEQPKFSVRIPNPLGTTGFTTECWLEAACPGGAVERRAIKFEPGMKDITLELSVNIKADTVQSTVPLSLGIMINGKVHLLGDVALVNLTEEKQHWAEASFGSRLF